MKRTRLPAWVLGLALLSALGLTAVTAAPADAMQSRTGDDVLVAPGETIKDDLIVFATSFTLQGTVEGDLIVVANEIFIDGTVDGDFFALGGTTDISGTVTDDVRLASGFANLTPGAVVGDDLFVATIGLRQSEDSEIAGQLGYLGIYGLLQGVIGAGGDASGGTDADAEEKVDADAYGGSPDSQTMRGDGRTVLAAFVRPIAPALAAAPSGDTGSDIQARAVGQEDEAAVESSGTGSPALDWALEQLRRWFVFVVFGLLLLWLAPKLADASADRLADRPLYSLAWGFAVIPSLIMLALVVIAVTVALVFVINLLTITQVLGLTILAAVTALLVLVLATLILTSYVGYLVAGYELGRWSAKRLMPSALERPWVLMVLGAAVIVILSGLPRVGPLFAIAAVLMGLGSIWLIGRDALVRRWAPEVVAEA